MAKRRLSRKAKARRKVTPQQFRVHLRNHLLYASGDSKARKKAQEKIKTIIKNLDEGKDTR
jgi:hypothetical protein